MSVSKYFCLFDGKNDVCKSKYKYNTLKNSERITE